MVKKKIDTPEGKERAEPIIEGTQANKDIRERFRMALKRRSWNELSPAQKTGNIVLAIVELILTAWALLDIKNRPQEQINGKKITWVMTSLIQPVGPIIYFIFGRKREMAEA
jgi:hypothetical protein